MSEQTLSDFAKVHGQSGAAEKLGCTQGAIRKAIVENRKITVVANDGGQFKAFEVRPFPSKGHAFKSMN